MAKNIIKFIHSISQMIECDELVREYIKVVFLPDYKVTLAEKIIPLLILVNKFHKQEKKQVEQVI